MGERVNGYDDEFDYAGKDMVAVPRGYRGMGKGTVRGYIGTPQGKQNLGSATGAVMAGLQARLGGASGMARAMGVWRQMGDPRVRAHVQGLYLRQNRVSRELVAYVDASVWMHEFSMLAPAYLQEWNHLCQVNGLDMQANKLTFRLSTQARAAGQTGAISTAREVHDERPIPLTPDETQRVARAVSVISNDRLRAAAYGAMKSVMEWDKGKIAKRRQNGA